MPATGSTERTDRIALLTDAERQAALYYLAGYSPRGVDSALAQADYNRRTR